MSDDPQNSLFGAPTPAKADRKPRAPRTTRAPKAPKPPEPPAPLADLPAPMEAPTPKIHAADQCERCGQIVFYAKARLGRVPLTLAPPTLILTEEGGLVEGWPVHRCPAPLQAPTPAEKLKALATEQASTRIKFEGSVNLTREHIKRFDDPPPVAATDDKAPPKGNGEGIP